LRYQITLPVKDITINSEGNKDGEE